MSQTGQYIKWPEIYERAELTERYHNIPLRNGTITTLRRYFKALATFYGIITLEKAYEIIHQQCPRLVTKDEFLAFAEVARHECDNYCIMGEDELFTDVVYTAPIQREIIDWAMFELDDDQYSYMKYIQKGKPFYIPPKQELLKYSNEDYYEKTPQYEAMRHFLYEESSLPPFQAIELFEDILFNIRYTDPNQTSVDLSFVDTEQMTEKEFRTIHELWTDLNNNSRMPCNRGYTPAEMGKMRPPKNQIPKSINIGPNIEKAILTGDLDPEEFARGIMEMDLPSEELRMNMLSQILAFKEKRDAKFKKVGRNDPCPCGSGKKYKHCCGR